MLRSVSRSVTDGHARLPEIERIAALDLFDREAVFRAPFAATVNLRGIHTCAEFPRTAHQIRVDMCFEDVGDGHLLSAGQLHVLVHVRSRGLEPKPELLNDSPVKGRCWYSTNDPFCWACVAFAGPIADAIEKPSGEFVGGLFDLLEFASDGMSESDREGIAAYPNEMDSLRLAVELLHEQRREVVEEAREMVAAFWEDVDDASE